jgi:hypothetical protein
LTGEVTYENGLRSIKGRTKESVMATPLPAAKESAAQGRSGAGRDALACLGAELLRRAEESQPALEMAWDELMASWGIHGEPLGIQRLREMIQQESGGKPDDNKFSRELIALRCAIAGSTHPTPLS